MNSSDENNAAKTKPGPTIDPGKRPLSAEELAEEGAQDRGAWHGARDRQDVQRDRTQPDEIDIERGDEGKTRKPTSVPDEELLPPD